ncbi:MAG: epoxyqueuosine reductase QueH [Lachnospiraceae bacterium]|nr:epoxyqueuosine reductase QueH [Lachnospiraceae bacterium]
MENNNSPKPNYQKQLEQVLGGLEGKKLRLLLHTCCAPCSSYCLEYLLQYFDITVFYYNPNITEEKEYRHRSAEQQRLIEALGKDIGMQAAFAEGAYEPQRFLEAVKGLEQCKEGGARCEQCFRLRLEAAADHAAKGHYDFYTTSLTISPLKNAGLLNEIGREMGEKHGVAFLPSDFKKRGGYQRSVELSEKYGLYRQDYCGCAFSKAEREAQKRRSAEIKEKKQ